MASRKGKKAQEPEKPEGEEQVERAPQPGEVSTLPAGFKVKKQVILPVLSLQVAKGRILKILDAMRVSNIKADPSKPVREKPATVCGVVDATTGENFVLIVPAVMEGNLREQYPKDSYVGKTFFIMKKPKRPGKRYFDIELSEVDEK